MELTRVKRSLYKEEKLNIQEKDGYTYEEAQKEAQRCLNCAHKPCERKGCVANLPVPDFIQALKNNDLEKANNYIYTKSKLSRICCRVCFHEKQCEGSCTLGIKGESIAIGLLERYIGDHTNLPFNRVKLDKKKSVGILGSGPAGLSCALELLQNGINITIYEKQVKSGGVMRYGIPNYRLDNRLVDEVIESIGKMGGVFKNGVEIGKDVGIEDLLKKHQYLFISTGAGKALKMGAVNENHQGVLKAYEVLAAINESSHTLHNYYMQLFKGKIVKVVGGGNVAMDVSRVIARLAPQSVSILYRRSENELPARKEEILEARMDGVNFELLLNPYEFVGNNECLEYVLCREMVLGDIDTSGRRSVSEDAESSVKIDCDYVVIAIGGIGEEYLKHSDIEINRKNLIENIEVNYQTNNPSIFAGGDVVTGPLTVVSAMKQGIDGAKGILEVINK